VQKRMKTRYDARRQPPKFEKRQLVMRKRPEKTKKGRSKKLTNRWEGPYEIVKIRPPVNIDIKKKRGKQETQTVHVDNLKHFHTSSHGDVSSQAGRRCDKPPHGRRYRLDYVDIPPIRP
jgi:hypothetical protein